MLPADTWLNTGITGVLFIKHKDVFTKMSLKFMKQSPEDLLLGLDTASKKLTPVG